MFKGKINSFSCLVMSVFIYFIAKIRFVYKKLRKLITRKRIKRIKRNGKKNRFPLCEFIKKLQKEKAGEY
jgi:hypothetical protein